MRSKVEYDGKAVIGRRFPSTYFEGMTMRNNAPQSVKPKPENAKIVDVNAYEAASSKMPDIKKANPNVKEMVIFALRLDCRRLPLCG